jgi:hypothetical protein
MRTCPPCGAFGAAAAPHFRLILHEGILECSLHGCSAACGATAWSGAGAAASCRSRHHRLLATNTPLPEQPSHVLSMTRVMPCVVCDTRTLHHLHWQHRRHGTMFAVTLVPHSPKASLQNNQQCQWEQAHSAARAACTLCCSRGMHTLLLARHAHSAARAACRGPTRAFAVKQTRTIIMRLTRAAVSLTPASLCPLPCTRCTVRFLAPRHEEGKEEEEFG